MTTHFTFFESYYDSVKELDNDIKAEFYDVLFQYALYDQEIEINNPIVKALFTLAKPNLDKSKAKAKAGQKGGKAKTETKQTESKSEAESKQSEANEKQTPSDKDKDKEIGIGELKNTKKDFGIFVDILSRNATIPSKVTRGRGNQGYELFIKIEDKEKLYNDYLKHQVEKGEFASTLANYMQDYTFHQSKPLQMPKQVPQSKQQRNSQNIQAFAQKYGDIPPNQEEIIDTGESHEQISCN